LSRWLYGDDHDAADGLAGRLSSGGPAEVVGLQREDEFGDRSRVGQRPAGVPGDPVEPVPDGVRVTEQGLGGGVDRAAARQLNRHLSYRELKNGTEFRLFLLKQLAHISAISLPLLTLCHYPAPLC
jgi:hypothetical protein